MVMSKEQRLSKKKAKSQKAITLPGHKQLNTYIIRRPTNYHPKSGSTAHSTSSSITGSSQDYVEYQVIQRFPTSPQQGKLILCVNNKSPSRNTLPQPNTQKNISNGKKNQQASPQGRKHSFPKALKRHNGGSHTDIQSLQRRSQKEQPIFIPISSVADYESRTLTPPLIHLHNNNESHPHALSRPGETIYIPVSL